MARTIEAAQAARSALLPPSKQDLIDLLDRHGKTKSFDPSYGETVPELLPRRLSELLTRH